MNSGSNELALPRRATGSVSARVLLPSYAATLFLSAALLFLVQPMLTKMVLPQFGGAPTVWNTCLCFFQATLLLGCSSLGNPPRPTRAARDPYAGFGV